MKKILFYLVFVVPLTLSAFSLSNVFKSDKNVDSKKVTTKSSIAIGKFQLKGNTSQSQYSELLSEFRDYVDDSFSKNSNFIVINKSRVDEIMMTNGLDEKTTLDFKNLKLTKEKIAKYKQFNADYVLLGDIRNFSLDKLRGSKLNNGEIATLSKKQVVVDSYVSIALINVATQEIVAKENAKIKKIIADNSNSDTLISTALSTIADELVSNLLLSITDEIKVISIQDDEIVLNKGIFSGLKVGMTFELFNKKKIEDYETEEKVATIKIKRVDKEISFASINNIIKLPKKGNIAKYKKEKENEFIKEKIRIAISKTNISENNFVLNRQLASSVNNALNNKLSNSNVFIVDNKNMDDTLAQQLLDALSKGREAGLPIGSIRGVDYLVSINIDYVLFNERKVDSTYSELLDMNLKSVKNAKVKMHGNVYLIDVQTNNRIVDAKVSVKNEFKKDLSMSEMRVSLSEKFTDEAIKIIFNKLAPPMIIRNNGMSVVLDSGKNRGLNIGDIFTVYSKGEMITDNRTGQSYMSGGMPVAKIKIDSYNNKGEAIGVIIQGVINQNNLEVKLDEVTEKIKETKNTERLKEKKNKNKSTKKYVIIKDLLIDETVSKYKHKYLKESKIDTKIKEAINKSKMFRTLSRDKEQIKQLMMEKQIALSDISDDVNEDSMRLSVADYILIPKVTRFKLSKSSKKIEYIDSYENREYLQLELKITLMNRKGEVIFDNLNSDKYSRSWASDNKQKGSVPSRSSIYKLSNKVVKKSIDDVINNKLDILSDGFLTVVEVGKLGLFIDLAQKSDVQVGDTFYVYPEPKIKEISRTGKKRLSYGSRVAEVKIDAIFDDGAEAIVTRGDIKDIKENFILRKKH